MIRYTRHAWEAMQARRISSVWAQQTILAPDLTDADLCHPERLRSYKAIAALGGRVLRLAHRRTGEDMTVITAYFASGVRRC